jgi:hypothetical protein
MSSRLIRPWPRRPAWLYPVGTLLTLRDGRTFQVAVHSLRMYDIHADGEGYSYRVWTLEEGTP